MKETLSFSQLPKLSLLHTSVPHPNMVAAKGAKAALGGLEVMMDDASTTIVDKEKVIKSFHEGGTDS